MNAISLLTKQDIRKETDSLGEVDVPSDMLWDLIPREMIAAFAKENILTARSGCLASSRSLRCTQDRLHPLPSPC